MMPYTEHQQHVHAGDEVRSVSTFFTVHTLLLYALALLLAYGLKTHYSRAGSDALAWILWPTARLVSGLSGLEFVNESGTGYVNYSHGIIIAPACAGVNFLIAAWCMAICSFLHRFRRVPQQWLWFGGCAAGTYGLTILTNAVRIVLAVILYHTRTQFGWLTPERLHRLEGILIYFGALCLSFWLLQRVCLSSKQQFRRFFIPLFWYFGIILIIPGLRLANHGNLPRFVEHSVFVVGGCGLMLIAIKAIPWLRQACFPSK